MALAQRNFDPIARAKSQLSNENRGWSQKGRKGALSRLSNVGLPSHRDEYWKYTNPAELISEKPNISPVSGLEDANVFLKLEALKVVFCDGIFSPELTPGNLKTLLVIDARFNFFGGLMNSGSFNYS